MRDGVILRRPKQEAAYLFVNSANEHIRFRYLHMMPRKMDEDNLLSGRRVHEGEVIGQIGNLHKREGGTSYHLHFDIQVPTTDGWVFVNPYMTLVAAYERLIGGRGEEIVPAGRDRHRRSLDHRHGSAREHRNRAGTGAAAAPRRPRQQEAQGRQARQASEARRNTASPAASSASA